MIFQLFQGLYSFFIEFTIHCGYKNLFFPILDLSVPNRMLHIFPPSFEVHFKLTHQLLLFTSGIILVLALR